MLDKILLVILVLLMPLGLLASFFILDEPSLSLNNDPVDVDKIEQIINDAVKAEQPAPVSTPKPFSLAEVSYSTVSGRLKVKAKAPDTKPTVMVSATVLPIVSETGEDSDEDPADESSGDVQGLEVKLFSIVPKPDRTFTYELDLSNNKNPSIAEIRLEQNDSYQLVRYDIANDQPLP